MPGIANSPSQVFQADKMVAAASAPAIPSQNLQTEDGIDIIAEDGQQIVTE